MTINCSFIITFITFDSIIFDTIPKGVEKKLVLIEGATHNDILSFKEQYFKPLKEFIQNFK